MVLCCKFDLSCIVKIDLGLQSLSRITFERNLSSQFSPRTAPLPLHDHDPFRSSLRSRSMVFAHARSPFRSRSLNFRPTPLRLPLRSRSAHMLWPRPLLSSFTPNSFTVILFRPITTSLITQSQITCLQQIQNSLARGVAKSYKVPKFCHNTVRSYAPFNGSK